MSIPADDDLTQAISIVGTLRVKGVRLWAEHGELRYRAPKGVLTSEDVARLSAARRQLVALLRRDGAAEEDELAPRLLRSPVAMTSSQLAHWRVNRLQDRPSVRNLSAAVRFRGRLDLDALAASFAAIMQRHEALRTRIAIVNGAPMQTIAVMEQPPLEIEDLTGTSAQTRSDALMDLIHQLILEPVSVLASPLIEARLARLANDEHVMIVVMEHMVSDAFSVNVLMRDLLSQYCNGARARDARLPELTIQFADYAAWQERRRGAWRVNHLDYWRERLRGCSRLRFPSDGHGSVAPPAGWTMIPITIVSELKARLQEWCRSQRTTLVLGVFTIVAALVFRWCDATDMVVRYQTNGRLHSTLMNTIGFFASMLHLRLELEPEDRMVDLLERVTGEYCRACEHHDFSYVDAEMPGEFTRNFCFNWVSQEPCGEPPGTEGLLPQLGVERVRFTNPILRTSDRDSEPVMLLFDRTDGIDGGVFFPAWRFSPALMQRFARNFHALLERMMVEPHQRVRHILVQ